MEKSLLNIKTELSYLKSQTDEDLKIQIRFFNQNLKNWKILDKKINDFLKRHMKIKLGNR